MPIPVLHAPGPSTHPHPPHLPLPGRQVLGVIYLITPTSIAADERMTANDDTASNAYSLVSGRSALTNGTGYFGGSATTWPEGGTSARGIAQWAGPPSLTSSAAGDAGGSGGVRKAVHGAAR
eukprot:312-Chlamydomonas_euryale.AAC.1